MPTETSVPALSRSNFVAPNSCIVGDVTLGQNSSVWYGAVLRGDVSQINIGEDSIVQDRATIKRNSGSQVINIGRGVIVSANSTVGGATLQDFSFVGMGSTVEDSVVVESYSVIAAGAVVPAGSVVPSGQIWAGSPVKYLREVTSEEREAIREYHNELKNLAAIHCEETEKTFEQVFEDEFMKDRSMSLTWKQVLAEKLENLGYTNDYMDHTDVERVKGFEYFNMYERQVTELYSPQNWKPFKEDAAVYPEDWKIYGEDMESYDRAKKLFDQPPKLRDTTPSPAHWKDESPWTRRY